MKLYRGDSFFNNDTEPGRYRTEGIRTKTFGKGDPAYIERNGLINAIRKHVKPDKSIPSDLKYYSTTDFISFTEDRDRALYWLSARGKNLLTPCKVEFTETGYLFKMEIDLDLAEYLGDGIYLFRYSCNPKLKTADAPDLMTALAAAAAAKGCELCHNTPASHQLILVNSEDYLKSQNVDGSLDGHVKFAHNDKEWLLLPADPMTPRFLHARIPRSDIWQAELFNDGEIRDPMKYASLGIIDEE